MRPYIKNVVNEIKFTYVAEEYKEPKDSKLKKTKMVFSNLFKIKADIANIIIKI